MEHELSALYTKLVRFKKGILFLLIGIMTVMSVHVRAEERSMEMDFVVLFHQDLYNIDTTYRSNAEQVNAILDMIDSIYRDSTIQLKQIEIQAFASPDGLLHKNMILSNNRAKSVRNYILANTPPQLAFWYPIRAI